MKYLRYLPLFLFALCVGVAAKAQQLHISTSSVEQESFVATPVPTQEISTSAPTSATTPAPVATPTPTLSTSTTPPLSVPSSTPSSIPTMIPSTSSNSIVINGQEMNPANNASGSIHQDGTNVTWDTQSSNSSSLNIQSTGGNVSVHSSN